MSLSNNDVQIRRKFAADLFFTSRNIQKLKKIGVKDDSILTKRNNPKSVPVFVPVPDYDHHSTVTILLFAELN